MMRAAAWAIAGEPFARRPPPPLAAPPRSQTPLLPHAGWQQLCGPLGLQVPVH